MWLLDGDHSLIIEAFNKSLQFAEKLEHFETPFLDAFLDGLKEDAVGNILAVFGTPNGNKHQLLLNYTFNYKREPLLNLLRC